MQILQICNDYRDNSLYENLFTELYNKNIIQTVYVPFKKKISINKELNYKVIQSNCYNNLDRIFFRYKQTKIFYDLDNNINLNTIDLVHAHTLFSNGSIAYKIKNKYNINYIVTIRSTDIEIFYKKLIWLRKEGNKILRNASKIIFLTPVLKKKLLGFINDRTLIKYIEENSEIIPNGIDQFWHDNRYIKSKKKDNIFNLVQVGWINENKNQIATIKAIEKVNEQGFNCRITFIGDVEYKKHQKYMDMLLDIKENSKYKENIIFKMRMNKVDLIKEYRNADIFILPSHRETFGLVYIEAISQGLPLIHTKFQSIDGIFSPNISIGCNSYDENDIANKIKYIVNDYNKRINSINDVSIENFSWKYISNKIKNLYMSI